VRHVSLLVVGLLLAGGIASAQKPPLLPEKDVAALAQELSGETAKRNLEGIARFHRQRGSQGFHSAAELVAERARAYGLSDVAILQFPADGKILYGTQRSRPAWDAEFAELRQQLSPDIVTCDEAEGKKPRSEEQAKEANKGAMASCDAVISHEKLLASYETQPIVLAEDSESADVTADLVDVGEGTKESDYAGQDVKGKIVLVAAQPGAVQDLAIGKFGAAGILSYAQNQKTAWWGEDENLSRWGHLETFSPNKTFAFMVSLKTARTMRDWLAQGSRYTIRLHATVKAGQHPGNYEVVTATIPGADPKRKDEEIAFSCHLDHQRPGANDNASGCVTILEVARTLQKLIAEGKLARPARTMRFLWPPEIEGTLALLNAKAPSFAIPDYPPVEHTGDRAHRPPPPPPLGSAVFISGPELAKRIKAVIHMDMVGGAPLTKAVFHVTRGPMSLPSFVHEVAWDFADFVNEQSYKFAATGSAQYPLVAPEGGKEPLQAQDSAYTMGSDHDVYQDSSFQIPAIYLNDWPDRYIHTNFDTAANIDPTKLKRAAFIGAASGYFLAGMTATPNDNADFVPNPDARRVQLSIAMMNRTRGIDPNEQLVLNDAFTEYVSRADDSIREFLAGRRAAPPAPNSGSATSQAGSEPRFARRATPKGPLAVFGYDYFADHAKGAGIATPKLLSYEGLWGAGEEYAYEVLNFADGKRSPQQIRNAVSAEYGPIPLEMVVEYLRALEKIGVIEQIK
jgi:aminopeptidase YwaD